MSSKSAHFLNLTQCLAIQSNNYMNKHNTTDYQPELIDARILELLASKMAKEQLDAMFAMTKAEEAYNAFLDLQGVPKFPYTYDHDTESYIMF